MVPGPAEAKGGMRKAASLYLCAYNLAQATGWLAVVVMLGAAACGESTGPAAMAFVTVLQAAAGLEVLHAACGLTKGAVSVAVMQWTGRSHCLYAVYLIEKRLATGYETVSLAGVIENVSRNGRLKGDISLLFPAMLMATAWALSEIVRYPHYAITTMVSMKNASQLSAGGSAKKLEVPEFIEWLRYSCFIPLYPVGLAAESTCSLLPCHCCADALSYTRSSSISSRENTLIIVTLRDRSRVVCVVLQFISHLQPFVLQQCSVCTPYSPYQSAAKSRRRCPSTFPTASILHSSTRSSCALSSLHMCRCG